MHMEYSYDVVMFNTSLDNSSKCHDDETDGDEFLPLHLSVQTGRKGEGEKVA